MKLLVLVAIVIASVSSVCANNLRPEITPAPKPEDLQRRQDYSDLIGWYSSSNYWYSYTCPSGQYYAAGPRFGACCPTGEPYCNPLVACEGNIGVYSNGVRGDW
ncbi:TPA_exp: hypothetical protein A8136_2587 [Trichophyton benhamiae CBS 112371]|nr:TPA_exp: hypothetical protein A8136_2587 [Trichophyton benhamiae CBS 112371]